MSQPYAVLENLGWLPTGPYLTKDTGLAAVDAFRAAGHASWLSQVDLVGQDGTIHPEMTPLLTLLEPRSKGQSSKACLPLTRECSASTTLSCGATISTDPSDQSLDKANSMAHLTTDVPARTLAIPDDENKASDLLKQRWSDSTNVNGSSNDITATLVGATPTVLSRLCRRLNFCDANDDRIVLVCGDIAAAATSLSYRSCTVLLEECIRPKLAALTLKPSRALTNAIGAIGKVCPRPLIDGVLVPLLVTTGPLNGSQREAIKRLLKDCCGSEDKVQVLVKVATAAKHPQWSEGLLQMLISLVGDCTPVVDDRQLKPLIMALQKQAFSQAGSLKYASLVQGLVSKHAGHRLLKRFEASFRRMLEPNTTFMKKAALSALDKGLQRIIKE